MSVRLADTTIAVALLILSLELLGTLSILRLGWIIVVTIAIGRTLDALYRPWRLGALLFGVFGALALVVASIGVYTTVAYDVAQRARDFGIRAALGAGFGDIVRAVMRAGLTPVVVGIGAGIGASLLGGKAVAALLYGIAPSDARVIAGAAAVLLGAGALAALVPARRAARKAISM